MLILFVFDNIGGSIMLHPIHSSALDFCPGPVVFRGLFFGDGAMRKLQAFSWNHPKAASSRRSLAKPRFRMKQEAELG